MIFYLVRHGQTDWNARGILQGCSDIPLNETGLAQAATAREKMRRLPIDLIVSSPLSRAVTTAKIINEAHQVPILFDERLVECRFGIFEGRPLGEYPAREFWDYERGRRWEGTETLREVYARVYDCLNELRTTYPGCRIALVMHGGAARPVYCYCRQGTPEEVLKIATPNAEPVRLEIADDAPLPLPLP